MILYTAFDLKIIGYKLVVWEEIYPPEQEVVMPFLLDSHRSL